MRWRQFHSKVHCTDYRVSLDRRLFVTRMSRAALIVNALFFDARIRYGFHHLACSGRTTSNFVNDAQPLQTQTRSCVCVTGHSQAII